MSVSPGQLEAWHERAAIREYCAGMKREQADRLAWYEVCPHIPYPDDKATQALLFPIFLPYHCDAPTNGRRAE